MRKLKRFGRRPRRKSLHEETKTDNSDESDKHVLEEQSKSSEEVKIENMSDEDVIERVKRESAVETPSDKTVNERSANWNHPSYPG